MGSDLRRIIGVMLEALRAAERKLLCNWDLDLLGRYDGLGAGVIALRPSSLSKISERALSLPLCGNATVGVDLRNSQNTHIHARVSKVNVTRTLL